MLYRGELIGVLAINELSVSGRAFTDDDARLLALFAGQAAAAVHDARLFEETRRRLGELEAVSRISTALRAARTLEDMLTRLLDEMLAVLGTDSGSIWLNGAGRAELRRVAARGWEAEIAVTSIQRGEGIAGYVYAQGESYVAREFVRDPRLLETARAQMPAGCGGACVPIRTAHEVIGVLFVGVRLPRELSPTEIHLVTTLAEIAGNAFHRMRLHESLENAYIETALALANAMDALFRLAKRRFIHRRSQYATGGMGCQNRAGVGTAAGRGRDPAPRRALSRYWQDRRARRDPAQARSAR